MSGTFQRYEKKYMISKEDAKRFAEAIRSHIQEDEYPDYVIYNLYFDTDDYYLINRSLEKPLYKEKIRLRSYVIPEDGTEVFLEIKKKFDGVVYKRRIKLPYSEALEFAEKGTPPSKDSQIARELAYTLGRYNVSPKIFLSYKRTAYSGVEDKSLRITFDTDILYRTKNADIRAGDYGNPVIDDDKCIMEIKAKGAYPLWLCHALDEAGFLPVSFSKVGTAYKERIKQKC